jgi:hypothetical protein
MSAMHLDTRIHAELLAGTLNPRDAARLARHLEAGCEACEAFLAERPEADAVDGRVDRALAAVGGIDGPGSAGEFEAIERRLRAAGTGRPAARGRRWPSWAAFAAAAGLLVAGITGLVARTPERPDGTTWDGTKGAAAAAGPVRLRFLVVPSEPAGVIRGGVSGDVVGAGESLEFEVELGSPAHVALVRVPPRGDPEVFWQGALGAGASPVTLDGRPAAYRLEGLGGRQQFVVVASDAPLAPDAAARAAAAGPAVDGGRRSGADLAIDSVEVRIE